MNLKTERTSNRFIRKVVKCYFEPLGCISFCLKSIFSILPNLCCEIFIRKTNKVHGEYLVLILFSVHCIQIRGVKFGFWNIRIFCKGPGTKGTIKYSDHFWWFLAMEEITCWLIEWVGPSGQLLEWTVIQLNYINYRKFSAFLHIVECVLDMWISVINFLLKF